MRGGVGTDDHDRGVVGTRIGAQSAQHFFSRKIRQMKIEKNRVGALLQSQVETDAALHGGQQADLRAVGQDTLDQAEIGWVVFNVQNRGLLDKFRVGWCAERYGERLWLSHM